MISEMTPQQSHLLATVAVTCLDIFPGKKTAGRAATQIARIKKMNFKK